MLDGLSTSQSTLAKDGEDKHYLGRIISYDKKAAVREWANTGRMGHDTSQVLIYSQEMVFPDVALR